MKAEKELLNSEKNRAENVMIVDLIRNDLGRICKYGSIKVQELFSVEKYESLFQMVSKIKGNLRKNTSLLEIIENVFPCGSITGAPKIKTMEIINEIEKDTRGIYTGSIALIVEHKIKMSVAIRTITLNKSTGEGQMGLGSGIVWDSDPRSEYEEVLLKSKFLTEPENYFDLFESMRLEKGKIKFLDYHLNRLKTGADFFRFRFSKTKALKFVRSNIPKQDIDSNSIKKVRLSLNKWGGLKIDVSDLTKINDEIYVIFSQNCIKSEDKFRNFKTTNRKLYDEEYNIYSKQGFYEVIYLNEKGSLAEGSRTNIFFRQGDNWFTPPIDSGVLPGVYRNYFINQHPNTIEKEISPEQLNNFDEMVLTNAVRGAVTVNKIFFNLNEYILLGKQHKSTREIEFKI
jgi:para-aminobenzoate synthetase/4-amino-4-deoxychorismate lyase